MPDKMNPLDISVLDEIRSLRREGKPDPLGRVVSLFLEHSGQLVSKMKDGLIRGDVRAVSEMAHSLKSSSGNVGALDLWSFCRDMEQAGKEANLDLARRIFPRLQKAFELAGVALTQYLNERSC